MERVEKSVSFNMIRCILVLVLVVSATIYEAEARPLLHGSRFFVRPKNSSGPSPGVGHKSSYGNVQALLGGKMHSGPSPGEGHKMVEGLHATLAATEIAQHCKLNGGSSVSDIQLVFFSDGFDMDYDLKANVDRYLETFGKVGPVNLSKLIQQHYHDKQKKLCCIISNPFVPWVADVASEHGILVLCYALDSTLFTFRYLLSILQ
ncbi:hypothetical protein Ddye_003555 [Dipteronia dyeriana]|uniref:Uncharacterized protein n=1 Tax=Dipteronia dyeriana TaxID=168575 RepID=A0AAD9XSG7_9ROSI|nr:hypothetical protein Ddye_003555 [Dipteronia dyeriana]